MDSDSILTSVKKMLGVTEDYEYFDADIIMHINSVFMVLHQLGVGPTECFSISDKTSVWADFFEDQTDVAAVKTYMYAKVRLMFDPPTSSALTDSMQRIIDEMEWRLCLQAEIRES